MSEAGTKEHANWVVTFVMAMVLFGAAYLGTLVFGNSLVEHGGEHASAEH